MMRIKLAASTTAEASAELSCVICLIEFSATRGVLQCGHRFCYSCIVDWARYLDSVRKPSTCPLCKEIIVKIMKVEDADCSDQKIYSQNIPSCAVLTAGGERLRFGTNPLFSSTYELTKGEEERRSWRSCWVCMKCREREPEDLLVKCEICEIRVVHSYCLDPYVVPWTCPHCRDLQSILRRSF